MANYTVIVYIRNPTDRRIQGDLLAQPKPRRSEFFRVDTGEVQQAQAAHVISALSKKFSLEEGYEVEMIEWSRVGHMVDTGSFLSLMG